MHRKMRFFLCILLLCVAPLTGCSLFQRTSNVLIKLDVFNLKSHMITKITVMLSQSLTKSININKACTDDDVQTFQFKNLSSGPWNVTFQLENDGGIDTIVTIQKGIVVQPGTTNTGYFIADDYNVTKDSRINHDVKVAVLNYDIVDAEYSATLDKIIAISSNPNQLHIYDPLQQSETAVDLPLTPTAVSVGPDGTHAAVCYAKYVSCVSLTGAQIVNTYPLSAGGPDLVLAENDYIYTFPDNDVELIHALNMVTGLESGNSNTTSAPSNTIARLQPNGHAIYGTNDHYSPDDIFKFSIEGGSAKYLYDSQYHGDYPIGGNLWISKDGLRIFTRLGNIFTTSDQPEEDITYLGKLSNLHYTNGLDHSSLADKIAALVNEGNTVNIYNYTNLAYQETVGLPMVTYNKVNYHVFGRYIFFNQVGDHIFVLAQLHNSGTCAVISF